jgi:hypothetical protein
MKELAGNRTAARLVARPALRYVPDTGDLHSVRRHAVNDDIGAHCNLARAPFPAWSAPVGQKAESVTRGNKLNGDAGGGGGIVSCNIGSDAL